jgi:hypothetical protein
VLAQFIVKRVHGATTEDAEIDNEDIEDLEDQEAANDHDPSREAADNQEIEAVSRTVALTYKVPAADARMGRDAVTKVRCLFYLCTNY